MYLHWLALIYWTGGIPPLYQPPCDPGKEAVRLQGFFPLERRNSLGFRDCLLGRNGSGEWPCPPGKGFIVKGSINCGLIKGAVVCSFVSVCHVITCTIGCMAQYIFILTRSLSFFHLIRFNLSLCLSSQKSFTSIQCNFLCPHLLQLFVPCQLPKLSLQSFYLPSWWS